MATHTRPVFTEEYTAVEQRMNGETLSGSVSPISLLVNIDDALSWRPWAAVPRLIAPHQAPIMLRQLPHVKTENIAPPETSLECSHHFGDVPLRTFRTTWKVISCRSLLLFTITNLYWIQNQKIRYFSRT